MVGARNGYGDEMGQAMSAKTVIQKITLSVETKGKRSTMEVDGVIYGQVAVHKDIGDFDDVGYTISHVGSGYAIVHGLKKGSANKVARELKKLGFDFDAYATNGYNKETPLYQEALTVVRTFGERW